MVRAAGGTSGGSPPEHLGGHGRGPDPDSGPGLPGHLADRRAPPYHRGAVFLLAHAGLALGAAVIANGVFVSLSRRAAAGGIDGRSRRAAFGSPDRDPPHDLADGVPGHGPGRNPANPGAAASGKAAPWHILDEWVTSLGGRMDLRVFLVGALLPDLIDKPLGRILYGTFGCRAFGHSLLFLLIVALAGLGLYRLRHQTALLALGLGALSHLLLDGMFLDGQTLLWPALGLSFPTVATGNWERAMVDELFASPQIYLTELAGMAILAYLAWLLVRRRQVLSFIRLSRV